MEPNPSDPQAPAAEPKENEGASAPEATAPAPAAASMPPPTSEQTVQILKEINQKLSAPAPSGAPALTREEIRERIKEQTGMTDAQLDFHESSIQTIVSSAVAPLQEKVAWSELKEEVGKIDPAVQAEMMKELSQYPARMRGDKILLEKIYDMTLGRMARSKGGNLKPSVTKPEDTVIDRKIVSEHQPSSTGLSGGSGPSKTKLSEEEKAVARKMRMSEEDYQKFKSNEAIESYSTKK